MKDNTTGAFVLKNLKVIIGSQKESGSRVEVQIEELTLHNNMGVEMDKGEFDSYVGFARDLVQTTGVILNAVMDKKHTQRLETLKTQAELGVDRHDRADQHEEPRHCALDHRRAQSRGRFLALGLCHAGAPVTWR